MYKLLPEMAREKVGREYLLRRTVVMLAALVLVLVVAVVGLLPSYVLSKARQKEIASLSAGGESPDKSLETWVSGLNLRLKTLAPKLDRDRPAEIFADIIKERGSGVKLTDFSWIKSEKGTELSVSGVARDRQALLSFESRLQALGQFTGVSLPVSNLAKDRDIGFEVKLSLKQP